MHNFMLTDLLSILQTCSILPSVLYQQAPFLQLQRLLHPRTGVLFCCLGRGLAAEVKGQIMQYYCLYSCERSLQALSFEY